MAASEAPGIVSIHSLTQRETASFTMTVLLLLFQSTPSRRGRPFAWTPDKQEDMFQSTPSRRGRLQPLTWSGIVFDVSIHSLTQRETSITHSPHLRKYVSIHSLTQRETLNKKTFAWTPDVSIHSLTQRETLPAVHTFVCKTRFNPLPHAEGDTYGATFREPFTVSIHSLTQRETKLWTQ